MSTKLNWHNIKEVAIPVIGVLLVFGLFAVNNQLDTNARNSDGGRSLLCLQLKAMAQPVEEYEPCMRKQVHDLWKNEPVKPVASHEMICQIVDVIQRPIKECEPSASG